MKINLLNLQDIDKEIKNFIFVGLFLYILSIYLVVYMIHFNLSNNITNLIITYILYFSLNFLGLIIILTNLNKIINNYKNEINTLRIIKKIIEEDKINLFKKIKKLEKK